MKAYKGFNRDMTCRGFQFAEGKTYETDEAELCNCGFHACRHPLEVFAFYPPANSEYHEVELGGDVDRDDTCTKVAAAKVKIGARLTIAALVKAAVNFAMSRTKTKARSGEDSGAVSDVHLYGAASATGRKGAASATGSCGAASASGYGGAASATGCNGAALAGGIKGAASSTGVNGAAGATGIKGVASATGDSGAASATGFGGVAIATGDYGAASSSDPGAVAVAWGVGGRAMGVAGSHIVLADWRWAKGEYVMRRPKLVKIDGVKYKPNVWYTMRNGKVVEDKDDA